MIAINLTACSSEFESAFNALEAGGVARRASWPNGMFLRKSGESIAVYRGGKLSAPQWSGPSSAESDAADWEAAAE